MSKHTEGQWHVSRLATPDYAPEYGIYAGDSQRDLARVMGPNAKDDAALIKAAPRLYKALQDAVDRQAYRPGSGPAWWNNACELLYEVKGDCE